MLTYLEFVKAKSISDLLESVILVMELMCWVRPFDCTKKLRFLELGDVFF